MSHLFFCGEVILRACSRTLARCTGIAHRWLQRTPRGNTSTRQRVAHQARSYRQCLHSVVCATLDPTAAANPKLLELGIERETTAARLTFCWAEAHIKIARMTLTIKLDGNWSSFQLANSAPPLSVTDSAIAPSARMHTQCGARTDTN